MNHSDCRCRHYMIAEWCAICVEERPTVRHVYTPRVRILMPTPPHRALLRRQIHQAAQASRLRIRHRLAALNVPIPTTSPW